MARTRLERAVLVEFQPMSPEEIERTVQFLLQQQAQFAADMAKWEARSTEMDARFSAKADRVEDGLVELTAIVGQIAAAQLRTDDRFTELGDTSRL